MILCMHCVSVPTRISAKREEPTGQCVCLFCLRPLGGSFVNTEVLYAEGSDTKEAVNTCDESDVRPLVQIV